MEEADRQIPNIRSEQVQGNSSRPNSDVEWAGGCRLLVAAKVVGAMCELLGLVFNQLVRPSLSFRGFQHRGADNPNGWGLAAFPDESAQVFKEPLHAAKSELATFLCDYQQLVSKIFIGHVRHGTVGGQTLANTHPFCHEFRGRHFVFAHNGTLKADGLRSGLDGRCAPVGKTDSELAMCVLLAWMARENVAFTSFAKIESQLRQWNHLGTMNVLFSEGDHFFAYHDGNGHKGLSFVRREAPFTHITLKDEDWEVDLAKENNPEQRGYVIATNPLTDENWIQFEMGSLLVFKDGELIYPSQEEHAAQEAVPGS